MLEMFPAPLLAPDDGAGADAAAGDPPAPAPNGSMAGGPAGVEANAGGESGPGEVPWSQTLSSVKDPKVRAYGERFDGLEAMLREQEKLRAELSDRVRLPGPKATPEEQAKFRKMLGVPDEAKGYEVAVPKGMTIDESDFQVINVLREVAHKAGMPQSAFQEMVVALAEKSQEMRDGLLDQIENAQAIAMAELSSEWGAEKDKYISLATRAAASIGGEEFVDFLNTAKIEGMGLVGDHPDVVRFLAAVGEMSDEADLTMQSTAQEKASAQARLNQIMAENPPGTQGYLRPDVQQEIAQLHARLHGSDPIVGATR